MRYVNLILEEPLIWGLFLLYLALTSWLAWLGHQKTDDIESYAVGKGDMHPAIVGVTLAASMASTATFVINPGFVYVHGVSALMHLGVAVGLGIAVGLVTMSTGFRRLGAEGGALTLPQWLGQRYGSKAVAVLFAAINLLSLSFVVLIVGALSIVMQNTLGLTNTESLLLIIGFVFSYIFIGGTYAHAYTNTLQGVVMVIITLVVLASGLPLVWEQGVSGFMATVSAVDPNLVGWVNPTSPLFSSVFTVFISGFVIGFALVCQPHIMTKALYVKSDKAVRQYLVVALGITFLFFGLLLVGLFAHVKGMPREAFLDPATGQFRQDLVMTAYVVTTFPGWLNAIITVALMAAGMSTLDGILVALSSIAANDLFLNLTENNLLRDRPREERLRIAHRASQAILVAMGVVAFIVASNPPKLLGIFGQVGVYGIVAASTAPILLGIVSPKLRAAPVLAAAIAGVTVHFLLYGWGRWAVAAQVDLTLWVTQWGPPLDWIFDTSAPQLGLGNPGVTATYGIVASFLIALPAALLAHRRRSHKETAHTPKTAADVAPPSTAAQRA